LEPRPDPLLDEFSGEWGVKLADLHDGSLIHVYNRSGNTIYKGPYSNAAATDWIARLASRPSPSRGSSETTNALNSSTTSRQHMKSSRRRGAATSSR
jgi:hypothetical protein